MTSTVTFCLLSSNSKNQILVGIVINVFKIFHLNICHITNNVDEIKSTILGNNPNIDVCGFCESFLTLILDDRWGGGRYVA